MRDLPKAKQSARAPYKAAETWDERHRRRLSIALKDQERIAELLADVNPIIATYNDGAHWKVRAGGRLFEWWPETGRLVIDKGWHKPRKAHDVDQVVAIVRKLTASP